MLLLYWLKLQERRLEEMKLKARLMGLDISFGEEPLLDQEQEVRDQITDPLKNFPNDVDYLNAHECNQKENYTKRMGDKLAIEKRWTSFRTECCLGQQGVEAKRCSMNDILWSRYILSLEGNSALTLEMVKQMVLFDVFRRELYPPDYKGEGMEPPPKWYTSKLIAEGNYDKIMRKLRELSI